MNWKPEGDSRRRKLQADVLGVWTNLGDLPGGVGGSLSMGAYLSSDDLNVFIQAKDDGNLN
jgi:hypothetical protein